MEGLYAFLRRTDDLVDNQRPVFVRRAALQQWERCLQLVYDSSNPTNGIWTALADVVQRYQVPQDCLNAAIDGARMDLEIGTYETFEELQRYCDCVSTSVGQACLHIWGAPELAGSPAARSCGQAIQLTNILRDVREDVMQGRVYLPQEDLRRFGCDTESFQQGNCSESFLRLMEFEVQRAEELFAAARPLDQLEGVGRPIVRSLMRTYQSLLARIKGAPAEVLKSRVRVPNWQRLWIVGSESVASRWKPHVAGHRHRSSVP